MGDYSPDQILDCVLMARSQEQTLPMPEVVQCLPEQRPKQSIRRVKVLAAGHEERYMPNGMAGVLLLQPALSLASPAGLLRELKNAWPPSARGADTRYM